MLLHKARVDVRAMAMKRYSIFPRASLTGVSLSDGLMSYLGHSLGGVLPSPSRDAADWAGQKGNIVASFL